MDQRATVESWTADNRHGTCCERLDDFDWVIPAGDLVGRLPRPEEDEELSDIEQDVCEVPDELPVSMETAVVESLCFPVVIQTRPQEGCDPVLPLPVYGAVPDRRCSVFCGLTGL